MSAGWAIVGYACAFVCGSLGIVALSIGNVGIAGLMLICAATLNAIVGNERGE